MKIENFSNYEIYPNEGKIWSYKSNKFVGNKHPITGYWYCSLYSDNGTLWSAKIHRVVWMCVNGEIPKGMQINHIDEDKDNNSISNLNIMTPKENTNWGTHNERVSKALKGKMINRKDLSKPVGAFKNGKLVMKFASTQEAKRNGYCQGIVSGCCRGVRKSYKGFQWKYIDEIKESA